MKSRNYDLAVEKFRKTLMAPETRQDVRDMGIIYFANPTRLLTRRVKLILRSKNQAPVCGGYVILESCQAIF